MRRILVLGGGGFIGRNVVRKLLEDPGNTVVSADIRHPWSAADLAPLPEVRARLSVVLDDFTHAAAFERIGGGFDHVYMLAAIVGVNRTINSPHEVILVNTALTMQTLAWIGKHPVRRLLFASSSENYAGTTDAFGYAVPTPEEVPLCVSDIRHPRFTYAVTKIHGESAFLHCAAHLGYECVVVRYQNIIGPEMGFGHAIPHIVQRFAAGESAPFRIYGPQQTRAFCYVTDAVDGTIRAMNTPAAAGQVYHIGNSEETSIDALTREIGRLMGYTGAYAAEPAYPGSVGRRCPDARKSVNELGYLAAVSWREAVARTVEWYRGYFASGGTPTNGGFAAPGQLRYKGP